MKHLFINSSAILLMVTTHCATAAVYDFDALVTDVGYYCEGDCPQLDDEEQISNAATVGGVVHVSFEYDGSPSNQDHYVSLNIDDKAFKDSLGYDVKTELTNGIPGSGDSDVLSISFIDELDSGDINTQTIIDIIFTDTTGTAFSSGEMPEELDLGAFSTVSIGYDHSYDNIHPLNSHYYEEYLDAEFSPVPLPPVIYLFASGLIGIFGITRRKRSLS